MIRVVLVGGALMIASSFVRQSGADDECLPCGPELMPVQRGSPIQQIVSTSVVGVYDPARNPADDLEAAIDRAEAEHKRILPRRWSHRPASCSRSTLNISD